MLFAKGHKYKFSNTRVSSITKILFEKQFPQNSPFSRITRLESYAPGFAGHLAKAPPRKIVREFHKQVKM